MKHKTKNISSLNRGREFYSKYINLLKKKNLKLF